MTLTHFTAMLALMQSNDSENQVCLSAGLRVFVDTFYISMCELCYAVLWRRIHDRVLLQSVHGKTKTKKAALLGVVTGASVSRGSPGQD